MKTMLKTVLVAGCLVLAAALPGQATLLAGWDFTGDGTSTTGVATSAADVFDANLDSSSLVTRGATAGASGGNNSFRTVGFKNEGISTANTDYFQTTLSAANGYLLSFTSIDARFAGTDTFRASPGVSAQFAYSLDGTTFNLIGSPFSLTANMAMPQISLVGIGALQNIIDTTTVYFRYYASGQTTTGGWGFNSPNSGQYGLAFDGTLAAVPEASTWVVGLGLSLGMLGTFVRKYRK